MTKIISILFGVLCFVNTGYAALVIGVAKTASVSEPQVTLDFYLENFSDAGETLNNISLPDDLDVVFGAGNYTVSSAPFFINNPGTINLNASFNGNADTAIIAAGSTLSVGGFAQIRVIVEITTVADLGDGLGVYSISSDGISNRHNRPVR